MRKKRNDSLLLFLVLATLGACTYEDEIQKVEEYSLPVLSPDGTRFAYLYHVMRYRRASGINTLPTGGIPLYLEDRVTLMLCDVKDRIPGGEPAWRTLCKRPHVVQELPFKYKPRRTHMSIGSTKLHWMTHHRIAYDLQSLSVESDKGEVEVPGR